MNKLIKNNFQLILAILFFLAYRLFFTWLLFENRSVPPEPDDSYYYLASAKKFPILETFEDFRLAYFSAWLNVLAILTNGNFEKAYLLNFIIGPFVILGSLVFLFKRLFTSKYLLAFSIVVTTFYSGSGAYHGFYWVVTSFYQLAMFFVVTGIALSPKTHSIKITALCTLLLIFSHPTSILVLLIFIIYGIIIFILDKKAYKNSVGNLLIIYLSASISITAYLILSTYFPAGDSPQSASVGIELLKNIIHGKQAPISLEVIQKEYFDIFFMNVITSIIYIAMLIIVLINYKKLFAIFIATLAPVILGVYMPYGSRTLAYVWPLTFILIAYVLYLAYHKASKVPVKVVVVLAIFLFGYTATVFNSIWVKSLNAAKDYEWNKKCAKQIENKKSFYVSLEAKHAFYLYTENPSNQFFLSKENILSNANESSVVILTNSLKPDKTHFSKIESLAANLTRKPGKNLDVPLNSWTQMPSNESETLSALKILNLEYNSTLNCGYYEIVSLRKK